MTDLVAPVVRRAILDLLTSIGGERNHDALQLMLGQLGHRVSRRDVLAALDFLAVEHLVAIERLEQYTVARVLADGRDVAEGRLVVDGVSRHRTGD